MPPSHALCIYFSAGRETFAGCERHFMLRAQPMAQVLTKQPFASDRANPRYSSNMRHSSHKLHKHVHCNDICLLVRKATFKEKLQLLVRGEDCSFCSYLTLNIWSNHTFLIKLLLPSNLNFSHRH